MILYLPIVTLMIMILLFKDPVIFLKRYFDAVSKLMYYILCDMKNICIKTWHCEFIGFHKVTNTYFVLTTDKCYIIFVYYYIGTK